MDIVYYIQQLGIQLSVFARSSPDLTFAGICELNLCTFASERRLLSDFTGTQKIHTVTVRAKTLYGTVLACSDSKVLMICKVYAFSACKFV